MIPYEERLAEARASYRQGMERVANVKDTDARQKFPIGTRVRIADDLGSCMSHFPKGCNATVMYTFAQAFRGVDFDSYSLDIDDVGSSAWYHEHQLKEIK